MAKITKNPLPTLQDAIGSPPAPEPEPRMVDMGASLTKTSDVGVAKMTVAVVAPPVAEAKPVIIPAVPAPVAAVSPKSIGPTPINVERLYIVERDTQISRMGSYYTLHKGQVLSSFGYDIDDLLRLGVPITETKTRAQPPSIAIL